MNEYGVLLVIAIGIVIAAIVGLKSGVATAFLEIVVGVIIVNLFHFEEPEIVHLLSELGLITLLFIAGLEVDVTFLKNKAKDGIILGLITFFVAFGSTLGISYWLFDLNWLQAAVFAVGLSECSTGIVYATLRKKGDLGPRRKIILSAATMMELCGIAFLTIFFVKLNWTIVIVVLFLLLIRFGLPKIKNTFGLFTDRTVEKLAIKTILATLLAALFLATSSGVDVILIVFVLGVLLAKFVNEHKTLKQEIEAISFGFLTPFFFLSIGFSVSIVKFVEFLPGILSLAASTFIITFLVSYSIAKKYIPKRARAVGFLLNAPMSVGFVAATLAFEKGVLDNRLYLILIGAVLLSSFVGIVFARYPADHEPTTVTTTV